jgi:hypothetical protein
MTFKLPSLLYRSALIQREIDAEQHRSQPDWMRVMRLKALRLKLMERLQRLNSFTRMNGFHAAGALGAC